MTPDRLKTPSFFLDQDVVWVGDDSQTLAAPVETFFSVEEVCRRFDVTPRALRHYEAMDLIRPARSGSTRRYSHGDCDRIAFLTKDRRVAAALFEIGQLAHHGDREPPAQALMLARETCSGEIARLEARRSDIEIALIDLRRVHTMLTSRIGEGSPRR